MCSYSISSRTDTDTDDEGNTTTTTVKEVNVELKTYRDMISEYGFNEEEQEILEELMKPEYLAMIGYTGGGGDPGDLIFYSYSNNGRFFNITHVAIYVGNGKVVEAANERIGVVYRSVQSQSSIVFIADRDRWCDNG